jgi:ABC-type antimicrobial peptide transport system permease subunit
MKKTSLLYLYSVLGLALLAVGLFLTKAFEYPLGMMKALPYVLVGVGCGVFGHGTGELISRRAMKNSPDLTRRIEIEKNDERNIAIANRAKAKAFDLMLPVFGALISGGYLNTMEGTKFSVIPIYLPVIALSISIAVGLLSGYFPARRATKIKAIEALKTES